MRAGLIWGLWTTSMIWLQHCGEAQVSTKKVSRLRAGETPGKVFCSPAYCAGSVKERPGSNSPGGYRQSPHGQGGGPQSCPAPHARRSFAMAGKNRSGLGSGVHCSSSSARSIVHPHPGCGRASLTPRSGTERR